MSDSRLEKFIYAICSMDVSDLPVPLSRIEKLWNCLITGETPDFEPLSRNEKYLMAMLDRYDISNLPAPMSRGEKLLYKIAVGETDLSDVPGYLSRYEELLKYLIENGGISGGDFEYVLYTLNQSLSTLYLTAEKPVKCAILKGQTLVNRVSSYGFGGDRLLYEARFFDNPFQKGETLTIFVVNPNATTIKVGIYSAETGNWSREITYDVSINKKINYIVPNNSIVKYVGVVVNNANDSSGFENSIVVVNGDQSHLNINTYFDGMQSVKMPVLTTTGKNLFDFDDLELSSAGKGRISKSYISIDETKKISFSMPNYIKENGVRYVGFDCYDYKFDKLGYYPLGDRSASYENITVISGTKFIKIGIGQDNPTDVFEAQLEYGEIATSYEPYKSNILTVNEELTLRGIGEVQDELNLLTGELTQRIAEVVYDGSEDEKWSIPGQGWGFIIDHSKISIANSPVLSDKYPTPYKNTWGDRTENCIFRGALSLAVNDTNCATVAEFKAQLSENPLTVQYRLKTESVKTVDLTVVDQDNQPTELGTFENVTHVSLVAENLIPEVEMEVATYISEELASASPLMGDISTKQEQLNTTVDEQSNNVDATMIATTEIFEEIL